MIRVQCSNNGSSLTRRILHELRFIQDDRVPRVRAEPLRLDAELRVVGDEQMNAQFAGRKAGERGCEYRRSQARSKTLRLGEPAVHHTLGTNDEHAKWPCWGRRTSSSRVFGG